MDFQEIMMMLGFLARWFGGKKLERIVALVARIEDIRREVNEAKAIRDRSYAAAEASEGLNLSPKDNSRLTDLFRLLDKVGDELEALRDRL